MFFHKIRYDKSFFLKDESTPVRIMIDTCTSKFSGKIVTLVTRELPMLYLSFKCVCISRDLHQPVYINRQENSLIKITDNWVTISLLTAIFAATVKGALSAVLMPAGLPEIAFPFCIAAGLFLLVTSESKLLMRVPMNKITWPEDHRKRFKPRGVGNVQDIEAVQVT